MEGNGIIVVAGRTVCFGTKAAELFSNFLIEQEKHGDISNWDWFVGLLYAGLVNEDYNERRQYTTFKEASLFADTLDKATQDTIYACYESSKPGKDIQTAIENLFSSVEKKSVLEASEANPTQSTGLDLESTQPKVE